MRNTGLDEAPAGISVAGRNINNLRNADDTTLMADSEEELKSLLDTTVQKQFLQRSPFFIVQLSHPYMSTGKTIALTRRTFVSKVMSLLLNMLSRLVITFLPRSKRPLISWLQSPSTVILVPPQNKVCQCFHCFLTYLPQSDGTRYHDLCFLNVEL